MRRKQPFGFYSFAGVFILFIAGLGHWIGRDQSAALLLCYACLFVSYLFLLKEENSFWHLLGIGLVGRLVLFGSLPSLSDDVYRFIWDGTLLKNGIHPFAHLPTYYLDQQVPGLDQPLYERLNSPNYFTIYPPINQAIFWFSIHIGEHWLGHANAIRGILLFADMGSLFLLSKLLCYYGKKPSLAHFYFLNPLVILEVTGNLHFEGLVVFFLLLGIYGYTLKKYWLSSVGFGLAIGTKLLPLIFLPYLLMYGIRNRKWWVAILAGTIGIITIAPLLDETFINGMHASLDLYFRKFEFNASIYFLARQIGHWIYGYNTIATIGPLLSLLSAMSIFILSWISTIKKWRLSFTYLLLLSAYLLFSTIVHPWYIIPLIVFGLLCGVYFPLVWSFMIFLTYLGYTSAGYELSLWIVALEYLTVFIFAVLEVKYRKWESNPTV